MDMVPLRDGRERAKHEHDDREAQEAAGKGENGGHDGRAGLGIGKHRRDLADIERAQRVSLEHGAAHHAGGHGEPIGVACRDTGSARRARGDRLHGCRDTGHLHDAGEAEDEVDGNARQREEHCRGDGHEHVVAGEASLLALENTVEEERAVLEQHLVEALGPAHALAPGVLHGRGLLVIDVGIGAVADANAMRDAVRRELDVLGEQMVDPAAVGFEDVRADHETRTADRARAAHHVAGIGEELGLAQEPQRATGGNPVRIVVLRVAVAGEHLVPTIDATVHRRDETGVEHVIGVEDEIRIVIGATRAITV